MRLTSVCVLHQMLKKKKQKYPRLITADIQGKIMSTVKKIKITLFYCILKKNVKKGRFCFAATLGSYKYTKDVEIVAQR